MTKKQHLYHGAALAQIAEDLRFSALNKEDKTYGRYTVNDDCLIYVKYVSRSSSPWRFTFSADELDRIFADIRIDPRRLVLALVCGPVSVCALDPKQIQTVVDRSEDGGFISVKQPDGSVSMWVEGSHGELQRSVRHNRFPDVVFDKEE